MGTQLPILKKQLTLTTVLAVLFQETTIFLPVLGIQTLATMDLAPSVPPIKTIPNAQPIQINASQEEQ